MWVLTASTLRCSSSAIAWLVAGVAKGGFVLEGAAEGEQDAALPGGDGRRGRHLAGGDGRFGGALAGAAEEHRGAAEAQRVAVAQAAAPVDPLLADEGAVAGEAVVEQGALVAHDLDLGVQGRDLLVPVEPQVGGLAAPDPERRRPLLDDDDPLLAAAVAEDEEGPAAAFGLDLRLQLGGAGLALVALTSRS